MSIPLDVPSRIIIGSRISPRFGIGSPVAEKKHSPFLDPSDSTIVCSGTSSGDMTLSHAPLSTAMEILRQVDGSRSALLPHAPMYVSLALVSVANAFFACSSCTRLVSKLEHAWPEGFENASLHAWPCRVKTPFWLVVVVVLAGVIDADETFSGVDRSS